MSKKTKMIRNILERHLDEMSKRLYTLQKAVGHPDGIRKVANHQWEVFYGGKKYILRDHADPKRLSILRGTSHTGYTNHNGSMEREFTPKKRIVLNCETWEITEEILTPEESKAMECTCYVGGRKSPRG